LFISLDTVDSTNLYAKSLLESGAHVPEGTAVSAKYQTAGRGQAQKSWTSEPGQNILCSFILYPEFLPISDQFFLSMAMALGITDGLKAFAPEIQDYIRIKWPNDIYIGDHKTGGILIENTLMGAMINNSIVGFGLNINQQHFDPALPNPTSLSAATTKQYDVDAVLQYILKKLSARYEILRNGQRSSVKDDYISRLYRFGQASYFTRLTDDHLFEGTITGIQNDGGLEIQTSSGQEIFYLNQISFHFQK
jgi:BirA family biotin operon repressor/biotin-[acetyl-CoA-carboxylase] ligase